LGGIRNEKIARNLNNKPMKNYYTIPYLIICTVIAILITLIIIKCNEIKEHPTSTYDTKQIEYKVSKDSFRIVQSKLIQVNSKLEAENLKIKLELKNAKAHENLVVKKHLETINRLRSLVPNQYLGLVDSIETLYKEIISSKDSSYNVAVKAINSLDSTLKTKDTLIKSYQVENIADSTQVVIADKEIANLRKSLVKAKRNEKIAYFIAALAAALNLIR
jgi:hypothetical protein